MKGRTEPATRFYGLLTRRVQRARLEAARPYLENGSGPLQDVGCGLKGLPGTIPSYVGCDRNPEVLALYRSRYPAIPFFERAAEAAGLRTIVYRRFLLGGNQLVVMAQGRDRASG